MTDARLDDTMVARLFGGGGDDVGSVAIVSDVELSGYADALAEFMLAETPDVAPPAGLRAKVLGAVASAGSGGFPSEGRELTTDLRVGDTPSEKPRRKIIDIVIPWAVAACFAALFVFAVNLISGLTDTAEAMRARLEKKEAEADNLAAKLVGGTLPPETSVTVLETQVGGDAGAVAVWDGTSQEVILHVFGLPPLDASVSDYQLWIVDPQYEVPVDGGIFQVPKGGAVTHSIRAPLRVDRAAAFAVTKEVKGGVEVSEGPHLLLGAVE